MACQALVLCCISSPEFAAGQDHRFVYTATALHPTLNRPQQALVKTDMQTKQSWLWSKHNQYYVGEPQFIPQPACLCSKKQRSRAHAEEGLPTMYASTDAAAKDTTLTEDFGWLVALCYDAANGHSELVVLNAQDIEAGPIAVLPLRESIPHGLHGNWSDSYMGPS